MSFMTFCAGIVSPCGAKQREVAAGAGRPDFSSPAGPGAARSAGTTAMCAAAWAGRAAATHAARPAPASTFLTTRRPGERFMEALTVYRHPGCAAVPLAAPCEKENAPRHEPCGEGRKGEKRPTGGSWGAGWERAAGRLGGRRVTSILVSMTRTGAIGPGLALDPSGRSIR